MKFAATAVFLALCPVGWAQCSYCTVASQYSYGPGPEITGDYARPYLYSVDTQRSYADPMYYYASDVVARWNAERHSKRTVHTMTKRAQIEK